MQIKTKIKPKYLDMPEEKISGAEAVVRSLIAEGVKIETERRFITEMLQSKDKK